ncbi:hypothetical protein DNTS_007021, partial [Danionella cerebrum]
KDVIGEASPFNKRLPRSPSSSEDREPKKREYFSLQRTIDTQVHNASVIFQMNRCVGGVCLSLIVCAFLTETLGMVIAAKEKRGWTLNSAGYLLGPRRIDHLIQIKDSPSARGREDLLGQYAIDSHRSLNDKHGLAGKREMPIDEEFKMGTLRISDEDVVHTIIDFLSYLKLKEIGAFDNVPSSLTSEEISQP